MALRGLGAQSGWASQEGARGLHPVDVTIDKFTKWIEAQSISVIKFEQAVLFFLDIIHRFGVLNSIIINNGTQFTSKKFIRFCDEQHIRID